MQTVDDKQQTWSACGLEDPVTASFQKSEVWGTQTIQTETTLESAKGCI